MTVVAILLVFRANAGPSGVDTKKSWFLFIKLAVSAVLPKHSPRQI